MKRKKIIFSLTTLTVAAFAVSLLVGQGGYQYSRSQTGDNGYIEFTNTGTNIKKLGDNKYSIKGTTVNGTDYYLISQSVTDIQGTGYLAFFTGTSTANYVSVAHDVDGNSPVRFQALTKVTLTTVETDSHTYKAFFSSIDGVNYDETLYQEITTTNKTGSSTFEQPANFLKVCLGCEDSSTLSKIKIEYNCSYEASDIYATELDKQNGIRQVTEAFDILDLEEYSTPRREKLIDKLNTTINAINNAVYLSDIQIAVNTCISFFNNSVRAKDITKGTWFDKKSADGKYEFDRDDDNNLVISYNGYPGHWVYIGTASLQTDLNQNNLARIRFSNDSDNTIQVCLQLTGANNYKVDSHTMNVAAHEVKTVILNYTQEVTNFYFFLDSCSEHNRSGQVTILETTLDYQDVILPFSKTVDINQPIGISDAGNSAYTLTEADYPSYIIRVDAMFQVDFKQNGDSKKYFGVHIFAGSKHVSVGDSTCHNQEITIDDGKGINAIGNMPIASDSKLVVGNTVYMDVSYCADNLEFKVISYTFYYGSWAIEESETVEVNTAIRINNVSKVDDVYYTATIPYSSFTKTGKVLRMDVNFTTVNTASYGKSQISFENFGFTTFKSGNNNVLNIGSQMDKNSSTPKAGTMTIYPTAEIDLNNDTSITMVCWWASASDITIDSVTMYTESLAIPDPVTGLEAHPIDSGMVLSWNKSPIAKEYEVYVGSEKVKTVTATFAKIDGLTNNTEYTFKVVAKNSAGSSDAVSISATPEEGAKWDTFIEGLNTSLEEQIGMDGIANFLSASDAYPNDGNNYRLKRVIQKMLNGEETTVSFMGGSITVGETATQKDEKHHAKGYAYYTYQWLKQNYDVANKSKFVNGSICGTGSEIGVVRAQKDVLDYHPDLVFIEFAANNGTTEFYKQSYESLIRKCMELDSDPAIVLVFSCTSYTKNGSEKGYMANIGKYYQLPMFSMQKGMEAICTVFDKNRTDPIFHNFTDDATHPNDNGHQLMAKGLCYCLRNQINRDTDTKNEYPNNPSVAGYDNYQSLIAVDNTNSEGKVTSLGSFVAANTSTNSTKNQSDVTAFQQGWKKTDTTVNEPMVIDVHARNFILIYEAGNKSVAGDPTGNIVVTFTNKNNPSDTGSLTWDVSKTCKQSTSGSTEITDQSGSGWQNPVGILIFNKASAADYTISIQMETVAGICTIMAFGYTA